MTTDVSSSLRGSGTARAVIEETVEIREEPPRIDAREPGSRRPRDVRRDEAPTLDRAQLGCGNSIAGNDEGPAASTALAGETRRIRSRREIEPLYAGPHEPLRAGAHMR